MSDASFKKLHLFSKNYRDIVRINGIPLFDDTGKINPRFLPDTVLPDTVTSNNQPTDTKSERNDIDKQSFNFSKGKAKRNTIGNEKFSAPIPIDDEEFKIQNTQNSVVEPVKPLSRLPNLSRKPASRIHNS